MLGKDKLVFDASVTLTENDNVGAFVRASDGTLITHTTYGGVEALDVSISNASLVVTATDFDIRDLVFATDKVDVSGSSVTVTATDLDIRDLSHTQDSVKIGDGTDFLAINADGSINVNADISVTTGSDKAEDSASASGDIGTFTLGVRNDARAALTSADGDYGAFAIDSAGRMILSTEKAEDSASASGDFGQFVLGVRNDTNAVLTSADGDYSALAVDSAGRLKTTGSITANAEKAEDSASASGDIGNFVLAVRQDTLASSTSADGDYAAFKENSRGALWTVPVGTVADDAADDENPVKVGSKSYSGALAALSADGDRADLISDDYRRIYVNSGANVAVTHAAVTVGTSAVALPTTAAAGRRKIYIQNLSNKEIYIGGSGVTTANGLRVAAGAVFEDEVGDDVALYGIAATAGHATRVFELA